MSGLRPYREMRFKGGRIRMVAERDSCSRYIDPVLWTRYHLYVNIASGQGEGAENEENYDHYGFDSRQASDAVWDGLSKRLEESVDKLASIKEFTIDDLDLSRCEGRTIRYLERGKVWGVFGPKRHS